MPSKHIQNNILHSFVLDYVVGSFICSDFLPSATALDKSVDGIIDIGAASLSGSTAEGRGLLGEITYEVKGAFSDSTQITITEIGLSLPTGELQKHVVRIKAFLLESSPADFDGDGIVGFTDFLQFASAFGTNDPKYDLDNDDYVGFTDFLIFAFEFGK